MRYIILILLLIPSFLFCEGQITVYNDGFALVHSQTAYTFKTGINDIYISNIPAQIEAQSIIIKPNKEGIYVHSQNFEYDLANTQKILEKYVGTDIVIKNKSNEIITGQLQYFDPETIGIIEKESKKLFLIKQTDIANFQLNELPNNFFLQPTLHWMLGATDAGKSDIDYSYITQGVSWDVTYNAVWDGKYLELASWVTINNTCGMAYKDYMLKLVAGEVQRKTSYGGYASEDAAVMLRANREYSKAAPKFSENTFSDYHLYTLDTPLNINNNEIKQLALYPNKHIKATERYQYVTFSDKVQNRIVFANTTENGMGLPMPKGTFKVYEQDNDKSLQFIGEDTIDHKSVGDSIEVATGYAFDVSGKTIVEHKTRQDNIYQDKIKVIIKNKTNQIKTVVISHRTRMNWQSPDLKENFKRIDANTIEIEKQLAPNKSYELTWTETYTGY